MISSREFCDNCRIHALWMNSQPACELSTAYDTAKKLNPKDLHGAGVIKPEDVIKEHPNAQNCPNQTVKRIINN